MFFFSGESSCNDTWLYDLVNHSWELEHANPDVDTSSLFAAASDYDSATKRVILHTQTGLWAYDPAADSYQQLTAALGHYNQVGRIDPVAHRFVLAGCKDCIPSEPGHGVVVYSLDPPYASSDITAQLQGCDDWLTIPGIGMDFDPSDHSFVIWPNGGNAVYKLDIDKKNCTKVEHPGGPAPSADYQARGRFRFFPALGVFAVVALPNDDAFVLRL
jgi:hypothetical protein